MKVKESEKVGLKLNIQTMKNMAYLILIKTLDPTENLQDT